MYKYLSRAVITPEGIKNFQKQKPTALKVGIAKFAIDYPDDVSAAAAAMTGFATITLMPLITVEEADKAFEKFAVTRPPQLQ